MIGFRFDFLGGHVRAARGRARFPLPSMEEWQNPCKGAFPLVLSFSSSDDESDGNESDALPADPNDGVNDEREIELFRPDDADAPELEDWLEEHEHGHSAANNRRFRTQSRVAAQMSSICSCSTLHDATGKNSSTSCLDRCVRAPNSTAMILMELICALASVCVFFFSLTPANMTSTPPLHSTSVLGTENPWQQEWCVDGASAWLGPKKITVARTPYTVQVRAEAQPQLFRARLTQAQAGAQAQEGTPLRSGQFGPGALGKTDSWSCGWPDRAQFWYA